MKVRGLLLALLILTACPVFSQTAELTESRNFELEAQGIGTLEVRSGGGDVGITSVQGAAAITVTAQVLVRAKDDAGVREIAENDIVLNLARRGNRAVLTSEVKKTFFIMRLIRREEKKVHLDIRIPADMNLNIEIQDGDLYASRIQGDCTILSGDGGCILEGISGKVTVENDSGLLRLSGVNGAVEIEDKSGDVVIDSGSGTLRIEDSTGDIEIRDYTGPVYISDTGGRIHINSLNGDLELHARGRGDVQLYGVTGTVIQNY